MGILRFLLHRVLHGAAEGRDRGEDVITPPKNRSSIRTLQMPAPLVAVLDEHKERCKTFEGFNDSCLICEGQGSAGHQRAEDERALCSGSGGEGDTHP